MEITAFRPLPDRLDLTATVVPFDALLTRIDHAKYLVEEKAAHCIAVLKGNPPHRFADMETCFIRPVTVSA